MRALRPVVLVSLLLALPLSGFADASGVGLGFSLGGAMPTGNLAEHPAADERRPQLRLRVLRRHPAHLHVPHHPLLRAVQVRATRMRRTSTLRSSSSCRWGFDGHLRRASSRGSPRLRPRLDMHLGVLVGASFSLVSNLSAFVQGKWDLLFDPGQNVSVFHVTAGILFAF